VTAENPERRVTLFWWGTIVLQAGLIILLGLEKYDLFTILSLVVIGIGAGIVLKQPVSGAIFLIPLSQPIRLQIIPGSAGISFEYVVIPVIFVMYLLWKVERLDFGITGKGLLLPGALLIFIAFVSLIISGGTIGYEKILPGVGTLYHLVLAGLLFVLIVEWINAEQKILQIVFTLVVSSMVVGVGGLIEYFVSLPFAGYYYRISSFFGTFLQSGAGGNPNALGAYLAITGLVGLSFRNDFRGTRRLCVYLSVLITLIALILTASRSAWLGFFLGALYLAVRWDRKLLPFLIPVLVAAAAYLLTMPRLMERLFSIIEIVREPNVLDVFSRIDHNKLDWDYIRNYGFAGYNIDIVAGALRVTSWIAGLEAFMHHLWIGVGLQMNIYYYGFRTAENIFLDIAVMTGVFGLLVAGWMVVRILYMTRSIGKKGDSIHTGSLHPAICAVLVCLLVVSLTGSVLFHMKLLFILSILFACLQRRFSWIRVKPGQRSSS
ncbi:MAG TPA: O-antigen ligase family protein, partial [Bacteroidota bacterium]|nr:O-antigen ligase family protein [Bacteroidota bacterium]